MLIFISPEDFFFFSGYIDKEILTILLKNKFHIFLVGTRGIVTGQNQKNSFVLLYYISRSHLVKCREF